MRHRKSSDSSSVLPLKVLFLSYLTQHQIQALMTDCHSAIDQRVSKLAQLIDQNYKQISSIVNQDPQRSKKSKSLKSSNELMQVIEQEQYGNTERDNDHSEDYSSSNQKVIQQLKRKFNSSIKMLQSSNTKYENIIYMYKKQLTDIAKELTKEKQLNQKIIKQLSQKSKDHNRSISTNKLTSGKPTTLQKSTYNFCQQKQKFTKSTQQHQSEDQQIRPPPKPFCQQCVVRQRESQKRQKQALDQRNKWKQLSLQITNLKEQLSRYQQQLINKQSEINKLNQEIKKLKQDQTKTQNQQKKKLRTMNTTLRGQKIVLQNQLLTMKKKNEQLEERYNITQSENKKLIIERQNLTSTIKWQQNTILDLRKNFTVGVKQQGQLMKKYRQMEKQNQLLCHQIQNQQTYLEQFVKKLKDIEISHDESVKKLGQKIVELQNIIEQKNQTILKLKMQNRKEQNNPLLANYDMNQVQKNDFITNITMTRQSGVLKNRQEAPYGMIMNKTIRKQNISKNQGFQENMIKVLNKKIVDKEEIIEKLLKQNQLLKEKLDIHNLS